MHAFVLPEGAYGEPVTAELNTYPQILLREANQLAEAMQEAAGTWALYANGSALPRLATPPDERPRLTATVVYHMADVLKMGRIRNEQRASFAHDTTPIDDDRQRAWWAEQRNRVRAWLYTDDAGATVGYGLLRQTEDGRWWSSVAVLGQFAGQGYGRMIMRHLIGSTPHMVWAEARNDNPAAVRLHNDLEWETLGADNDRVFFRTRPKVKAAQLGYGMEG